MSAINTLPVAQSSHQEPDYSAVKARQQATWASAFGITGTQHFDFPSGGRPRYSIQPLPSRLSFRSGISILLGPCLFGVLPGVQFAKVL